MYEAYAKERNVQDVARAGGVSVDTAKFYVHAGTSRYPAIKHRYQNAIDHAIEDQDRQLVFHRRIHRASLSNLQELAAEAISRVRLIPKGAFLVGPNGQRVQNERGEDIVAVDEATFSQLVRTSKELSEWDDTLHGAAPDAPPPPTVVTQIGINVLDPSAVAAAAKDVQRVVQLSNRIAGTPAERNVEAILAEEVHTRIDTGDEQDEADGNTNPAA